MAKKIAIACDHAALELKGEIIKYLETKGIEYVDYGTYTSDSCNYPDYAEKVCTAVYNGEQDMGILVCGTGIGMSIAANKFKGIRAAALSDHFSAKYTRLHNNTNVLCLGGRVIGIGTALELADLFVHTEFEGGRHQKRVNKITEIENNQ